MGCGQSGRRGRRRHVHHCGVDRGSGRRDDHSGYVHLATTGNHAVTLTFVGTGKVSYNLVRNTMSLGERSQHAQRSSQRQRVLRQDQLVLNETATATVVVKNNTARRRT